jgi:hypothetical protein
VNWKTAAVKLVPEAQGQFGNPGEGKRPPLEAVTRQRLVKTHHTKKTVGAVVNCSVYELTIAIYLFVVTNCKWSIYPITNPNCVYSH